MHSRRQKSMPLILQPNKYDPNIIIGLGDVTTYINTRDILIASFTTAFNIVVSLTCTVVPAAARYSSLCLLTCLALTTEMKSNRVINRNTV